MKRILGMVAMAVLLVACTACDDGNLIKDPALRACVQKEFDWFNDQGINKKYDVNSKEDLELITNMFACESKGVKSLEGIEYLVNVTQLRLEGNEIEDLSPLAELNKITLLDIDANGLHEISSLHGLESLNSISLMGNYLKNISKLTEFKTLTNAAIVNNCIVDFNQCEDLKQTNPDISISGCSASDQHPEKCQ